MQIALPSWRLIPLAKQRLTRLVQELVEQLWLSEPGTGGGFHSGTPPRSRNPSRCEGVGHSER